MGTGRASWRCTPGTTPTPAPHGPQLGPAHSKLTTITHTQPLSTRKPAHTLRHHSHLPTDPVRGNDLSTPYLNSAAGPRCGSNRCSTHRSQVHDDYHRLRTPSNRRTGEDTALIAVTDKPPSGGTAAALEHGTVIVHAPFHNHQHSPSAPQRTAISARCGGAARARISPFPMFNHHQSRTRPRPARNTPTR